MVLILHPQSPSAVEKSDPRDIQGLAHVRAVCGTEMWIIGLEGSSREYKIFPTALKMDQLHIKSWQLFLKPSKGGSSTACRHASPCSIALATCFFFQRHVELIIIPSWHFKLHLKIDNAFVQLYSFVHFST